jgi:hypothetical protein
MAEESAPIRWLKMYGILGDEVVAVEAYEVEGGYIVKHPSWHSLREFVTKDKLHTDWDGAAERLRRMKMNPL